MSNLDGRKVLEARMIEATHVEGCGNIGPHINAFVVKEKNLTMTKDGEGLFVTGKFKGKAFEFYIPGPNLKSVQFDLNNNA